MKCKQCSKKLTGKKKYCNDACRMAFVRRKPEQPEHAQPEQIQPEQSKANKPEQVAEADRIRPGKIPLPGDADYEGVCEKKDGQWKVKDKADAKPTNKLTPALLAKLPGGVSVPSSQPTTDTAKLTAPQLQANISTYTGIAWKHSPEYAELIHRLLTWTKQKLADNGHAVPSWKDCL